MSENPEKLEIVADGKPHYMPRGHHYRIEKDGSMTLWDDSGDRCYLDPKRPITFGIQYMMVPVRDEKGRDSSTVMSIGHAALVARHYRMRVKCGKFHLDVADDPLMPRLAEALKRLLAESKKLAGAVYTDERNPKGYSEDDMVRHGCAENDAEELLAEYGESTPPTDR